MMTKQQLLNEMAELQQRLAVLEKAEEMRRKYEFMVNTSEHPTTLISRDYVYEAVNSSYCKSVGKLPEDVIGRTISDIWGKELFEETIKSHIDKCFEWSAVERFYDIVHFPHLGRKFFEVSYHPYSNESGENTHAVVVSRDLSGWKKIEEELIQMDKLESLGSLAADIANNFNNILTSIIGNIDRAKKRIQSREEVLPLLSKAAKSCHRAKYLTSQLLTFSGNCEPLKRKTTFDDSLADVIRFSLLGSDVKFDLTIAAVLYPVDVDMQLVNKAITNVIRNAEEAMPHGGFVHFSVQNKSLADGDHYPVRQGQYVLLTVQDEGIGIPGKHLKSIFNPYFTTKQRGRGLGLSTAYSIIRTHSGYITAESELERGTTIRIYLPATIKDAKKSTGLSETSFDTMGKILVMDDDPCIRELARGLLMDIGFSVETAKNGEEATALFDTSYQSSNPFDLVILNLTISDGMGGVETLAKLKEIDHDIKAIASSGYVNDPVLSAYKKHGFYAALPKPYEVEELYDMVYETMHVDG